MVILRHVRSSKSELNLHPFAECGVFKGHLTSVARLVTNCSGQHRGWQLSSTVHLHGACIYRLEDLVDSLVQDTYEVLRVELRIHRVLQVAGVELTAQFAFHNLVDEVLHSRVYKVRGRHFHVLVH